MHAGGRKLVHRPSQGHNSPVRSVFRRDLIRIHEALKGSWPCARVEPSKPFQARTAVKADTRIKFELTRACNPTGVSPWSLTDRTPRYYVAVICRVHSQVPGIQTITRCVCAVIPWYIAVKSASSQQQYCDRNFTCWPSMIF